MNHVESRIEELNLHLPTPMGPVGNYVGGKIVGDLLYLSGHGPRVDGQLPYVGKVGQELTTAQGYAAAKLVVLNALATARQILGDLDRIKEVIRVFGMVNAAAGYEETPAVLDGASDLLIEIFGENGRHIRSAVGMAALPFNIPVEIEFVFRVGNRQEE